MTLRLLIATTNPAKAERLRRLCDGLDLELVDGPSLGGEPSTEEQGASHLANAVRKAVDWSRHHREAAVASDGGLVIPALGDGWESLLTRRATGGAVSDAEHASRLLARMRELSGERRAVHWAEALAVARDGTIVGAWETNGLHGRIAESYAPPPSVSGFWVSGLWVSPDGRRYGALEDNELAAIGDPWAVLAEPVRDLLMRLAVSSQAREG